ncbi:MAG: hypothetical protein JOZ55_06200, partial [Alphaproteobacteria bacterium]|nr:hypothetical protein [Alphaproteobacteria bacterium]
MTDVVAANPPADPAVQAELARAEWRAFWPLPFVAGLGDTATSLHIYSMGSFFQPLQ